MANILELQDKLIKLGYEFYYSVHDDSVRLIVRSNGNPVFESATNIESVNDLWDQLGEKLFAEKRDWWYTWKDFYGKYYISRICATEKDAYQFMKSLRKEFDAHLVSSSGHWEYD